MSKIPTAEEFEKKYEEELDYLLDNPTIPRYSVLQKLFKEFAKLHVKAALESAADNAEVQFNSDDFRFNFENAYPLTNIK